MGMVKMEHVNIYGDGREPRAALELLAGLSCFDPDDAKAFVAQQSAQEDENMFEPLLAQALGLLKDLGKAPPDAPAAPPRAFTFGEVQATVEKFAAEVAERGQRMAELNARIASCEQTKEQLYHLTGLDATMDEIFSCKFLKVRFGRLPKDSYVKLPYYEDGTFTFRQYDFDGEFYWGMYFVPAEHAEAVDAIFASLFFERLWVPDFVHGTPQDAIAKLISEQQKLSAERDALSKMADVATPADLELLCQMALWLHYEAQMFSMRHYVVLLDHSYYISGYVPAARVKEVEQTLKRVPGVRLLSDEAAGVDAKLAGNTPPVELKNNRFSRPFEMFVKMYGLPGYGDLDPTLFVSITYAILFGVMFGDVGQGILLGLIGFFIMYKKMHMEIGLILTRCSVFSVLFGFVYGSVFGFEHALDGLYRAMGFSEKPVEVLQPDSINTILILSVAAGVFIIVAAILTGIASEVRRGRAVKAVLSVNGLAGLVFYLSLIALLLSVVGIQLPFVGSVPFLIVCLVVPFLMMYFSEPIVQLTEGNKPGKPGEIIINGFFEMFDAMLSFASNTMSFLRVGGFVLAHAGMMTVVFTLAEMTGGPLYVLIVVVGNLFVMAQEGLFVGIQVLRLEFYEIFSRFFDANGRPFTPLCFQSLAQRAQS